MPTLPFTPRGLSPMGECRVDVVFQGDDRARITVACSGAEHVSLLIDLRPDENIVGFGQQYMEIAQRGREIDGWIESALHAPPRHSYYVAPLWYSSAGYAVHVATTAHWRADTGAANPDELRFTVPGDHLEAWVYLGEPAHALDLLTQDIGRPSVPADWAFSPWAAARSGTDAVLAEARRLLDHDIAIGAVWIDDYYDPETNSGAGICFPYPPGDYDLPRLIDGLHGMGLHALGYANCILYRETPAFDSATAAGLAVRDASGALHTFRFFHPEHQQRDAARDFTIVMEEDIAALLDFEHPAGQAMWRDTVERLLDAGWDGWMQDFGEQHPGEEQHNAYPLAYHRATAEVIRARGSDAVFFVRAGAVGAQAHAPIMWGGDQLCDWSQEHGLASLVPAGISAGLAGVAVWCPDIAGLVNLDDEPEGGQDEELWIRWMQFGALSPIMRVHLGFKYHERPGVDLWRSETTVSLFRRYAALHEQLRPYLADHARRATGSGMPVMRALLLEFPEDNECWSVGDQYLLGDALLVAPVLEPTARSRSVYFPAGRWRDYWTGETVSGPVRREIEAPLDRIPLFLREDRPSPLAPPEAAP